MPANTRKFNGNGYSGSEFGRLAALSLPDRVLAVVERNPMTARHLVRYLRLQWPRLLPKAIEATAGMLLRSRWIELSGERLRPRGPG